MRSILQRFFVGLCAIFLAIPVQAQSLSTSGSAVLYNPPTLTSAQQAQALVNIGAIAVINVKKFTASGTYTPSAGLIYAIIECVGGGASGGGIAGNAAYMGGGGGGQGGGYSRKVASAAAIGASQTVTIGGGAGANSPGANAGFSGGTTSVGSLCVANGGLYQHAPSLTRRSMRIG